MGTLNWGILRKCFSDDVKHEQYKAIWVYPRKLNDSYIFSICFQNLKQNSEKSSWRDLKGLKCSIPEGLRDTGIMWEHKSQQASDKQATSKLQVQAGSKLASSKLASGEKKEQPLNRPNLDHRSSWNWTWTTSPSFPEYVEFHQVHSLTPFSWSKAKRQQQDLSLSPFLNDTSY